MAIFGLILLNILILNIWLWITRNIRKRSPKIRLALIMWTVAAVTLFFYPQILSILDLSQYSTLTASLNISIVAVWLLISYLIMTLIINSWVSLKPLPSRKLALHTLIFAIIVIALYLISGSLQLSSAVIYYVLVAGSEEFIKYLSGRKLQDSQWYASSDIIIYCLLISLGFAFFENIVYLLQAVNGQFSRFQQLTAGSTLLFTRGLISFLVHLLFTGCIAVFALKSYQKKNITRLLVGITLGILLHLSYNLLLSQNIGFMILIYLIWGYIFLSWLFFQSDRLYVSE